MMRAFRCVPGCRRPDGRPAARIERRATTAGTDAALHLISARQNLRPPIPLQRSIMRHRRHLVSLVCAGLLATLAQPATVLAAGPPASETVYFRGRTAEINTGASVIFDAIAGLLQHASPIYIIGFPVAEGTTGPITLPSGYQPQHNGFPPAPIPYHD